MDKSILILLKHIGKINKKLDYLFFNTDDIKIKKEFLRDQNGKVICYDCKLEKKLQSGFKMKSKK